MRSTFALLGLGLLIACAPASRYSGIKEGTLPLPSELYFPLNETVERLITAGKPYSGLNYAVGDVRYETIAQYFYNVPELGEVTSVSFHSDPTARQSWYFIIQYPKVAPEQLFKTEKIKPLTDKFDKPIVFEVISGPLEGACVRDYSRQNLGSTIRGFSHTGDRAIVVSSRINEKYRVSSKPCE